MSTMIGYSDIDSPIHRLTGASKLIALIIWALASMITYDTRVLLGMFVISIIVFKISRVEFKQISFVLYFILIFLLLNNVAIFIFSPYEGVQIYGSRTDLFKIAGPYTITSQQLFYQFNMTIKYLTIIPIGLIFLATTNPSEFAASLNKLGISYRIAYSVSIAMRYIPDIQRDFIEISQAQQARGIDLSHKEKLTKRLKNMGSILLPLIFTSLERIETISYAMELRAFGKNKKRTFYSERPFVVRDWIAIVSVTVCMIIFLWMTFSNGSRFYNPFI